jgi:hypothetical protein
MIYNQVVFLEGEAAIRRLAFVAKAGINNFFDHGRIFRSNPR